MFKMKFVYRLITIFLLFGLMIVLPYSLTIIKQLEKMIEEEEMVSYVPGGNGTIIPEKGSELHKEFIPRLIDQMLPYFFYILVLAFLLSIFFSRKILISLKELQKGTRALRDGNLDIKLDIISDDEIGEVTKTFNEMASAMRNTTLELKKKDVYINAMLDPLWVVNEENRIVDINLAFTKLFGHLREDVIGASIYDFFDDKNAEIMRRQLEERREKWLSAIYEINIFAKDGVQMPVLISGSPIYSDGQVVGKIGILKDFREQVELRNELRQSRDYIENIMNSIEEEIVVIDKDYRIVKANKVALMNSDIPIIGEYCHKILHGSNQPCWAEGHECPAQNVFLTGKNYRTNHQHFDASGKKYFHEILASPIKDSSGTVINVIELIRDITDRMQHENELSQKNRELVMLNEISRLLGKSLKFDEIFSQVLHKLIEMMGMDGGGIFFIDDASREMLCRYHKGISDEYVKMLGRIRLGDDIPGKVAVTGQIMTTSDISRDPRVDRTIMKNSGVRGYCCIPIRGKERIIGVFCLLSFKAHDFTQEEENILSSIGDMTGIAVENIRLFEKMRELYEFQRKRREEEHSQLLSLSAKLGAAIDLKNILEGVLDLVKNFFGADFALLLVSDEEGNFSLKASIIPLRQADELLYKASVNSIERHAITRKKPFVLFDMQSESEFFLAPEIAEKKYHSSVAVPMFIGQKAVGVVSLYYARKRNFSDEELHFLEIIANVLAVSLERAGYYAKAISEKELSDTVLQSVADSIITIDPGGRVIAVNKSFEKMIGVLQEKAIGLPLCDIFRFQDGNESFRLRLAECFSSALTGKAVKRDAELTTAYGNTLSLLISSTPILKKDGEIAGVVNLLRDISREKEIDRMKTEIVRSVSHEFRTPLSAIVGMTEMILNGDIEESRITQYLNVIKSEGIRLSKMVSELLSIARIESGKESLKLSAIDLNALIQATLESFESKISGKDAEIRVSQNGALSFVGDEEKIKQVLVNIIDNALTFSDKKCIIEVNVRRKEDILEIMISDNGWGIPEEDIPHLTERFYRGKHGEKTKGTGLGLTLCDEIVVMHGGTLEIRSREGQGTSIIIEIPFREV
ncbi:MAG: PAS domain S-box protein [Nitrospirota bacterium]|nr:PAS domain S-box protein [Nitrospirota bacterium]